MSRKSPFFTKRTRRAAMLMLPLGLLVLPAVAVAQAEPQPAQAEGVQDIVVTATRKSESSQTVPIALTAISAANLEKLGVTSALQLPQLDPSMYVLGQVSEGSPRYSLRGISNSDTFPAASSAIASYVDDVFQASQFGISTALFDLQRVEVLRGPQGTTFGKNTTGGAVAFFAQVPTDTLRVISMPALPMAIVRNAICRVRSTHRSWMASWRRASATMSKNVATS